MLHPLAPHFDDGLASAQDGENAPQKKRPSRRDRWSQRSHRLHVLIIDSLRCAWADFAANIQLHAVKRVANRSRKSETGSMYAAIATMWTGELSVPETQAERSIVRTIAIYLLLAYGFSWVLWFTAFRLGGAFAELTGIAIYGPALAGMLLSYRASRNRRAAIWPRLICFAVAWLIAAVTIYGRARINEAPRAPVFLCLIPSLIPAWIISAALSRENGVRQYLRTLLRPNSWRWQAVAVLSFAVFLAGPALIARLLGTPVIPANMAGRRHSLVLTGFLLFGGSFFYGGGVSEEPGWRGYLQNRLQTKLSPLVATIIVWISWALWHLPLDLHSSLGASLPVYFGNRLLVLLPLTVIATWLFNRSRQSILTTALFHSAFNALPDVLPSAPSMSWLLWIWAIAVIVTDRMWRKSHLT